MVDQGKGPRSGPDSTPSGINQGVDLVRPQEVRPGTMVRVREAYWKSDLEGMRGIIEERWGDPNYLALDVRLDDGRSELFWFHQLEKVPEA